MTGRPLVSIVIPVLNGERHLRACVGSVLGQSYDHLEVVIADQASTDHSLEIVDGFGDPRVRVLPPPTEPLDLHTNWARGVNAATGELVKIVCHDDVLFPDAIAVQVELLREHPRAVLACSRRQIIDDRDNVLIGARGLGRFAAGGQPEVVSGPVIARTVTRAGSNVLGEPASVLIRRSALPDPLFDPRWRYTIDVEFYLRCLGERDAVLDRRVLCAFRISPKQLSAVLAKRQASELRAFFAELTRRYPGEVTGADARLGAIRAELLVAARRVLYWKLRVRDLAERVRRAPGRAPVGGIAVSDEPR